MILVLAAAVKNTKAVAELTDKNKNQCADHLRIDFKVKERNVLY